MLPRVFMLSFGFTVAVLAAGASLAPQATSLLAPEIPLASVRVASGLASPVFVTAPAGDPRLFIVEQGGRVRVVSVETLLPTPFLDVSQLVSSSGHGGLLGLAFAPDYAATGIFYVNYTNKSGDTVVARYQESLGIRDQR